MKKITNLIAFILTISVLYLFTGCQKIDLKDYFHPDKTPKLCKIKKILSFSEFEVDSLLLDFKYNHRGDPISIELFPARPGIPDFLFRYDNQHRLLDFVSAYKNNHYEQWHRYVYEGTVVVRDTARVFGEIVNGEPIPSEQFTTYVVTNYEYDSYNRIVKSSFIFQTSPEILTQISSYTYNAAGNLVHYKVVVPEKNFIIREEFYNNYDNKTNIHRTHKVWMFIGRDYSINNRIQAQAYNQYGLPLKLRGGQNNYPFILRQDISQSDIKYECK